MNCEAKHMQNLIFKEKKSQFKEKNMQILEVEVRLKIEKHCHELSFSILRAMPNSN